MKKSQRLTDMALVTDSDLTEFNPHDSKVDRLLLYEATKVSLEKDELGFDISSSSELDDDDEQEVFYKSI